MVVGRTKAGLIDELGAIGFVPYTECLGNILLEGLPYDLLKHQDDDHFLRQRVMFKTPKNAYSACSHCPKSQRFPV